MSDIGDITGRIALDMGDTMSQLAGLSTSIDTAFQSPDASKLTGAIDQVGAAAKEAQEPLTGLQNLVLELVNTGAATDAIEGLAIAVKSLGGTDPTPELTAWAQAIDEVAAGAGGAADGVSAVGDAAAGATGQLNLFDEAMQVPYADAAGQLNLFSDALEPLPGAAQSAAQAEQALGDAALGAIPPLHNLGVEAETTAEHAHEGEGGIKAMAEQLLAFGEALVVTEKLKEFGLEALTAADNVTHASIALTTITGSADTAKETIEGLEKLGVSDGLAFPSLLTAGTRMQQLLGPGADVTSLLGKIADGAAVMGTDIGAAANAFDRMATSGTVSARTLTPLGLSLTSLSSALNTVNPALDTTATSAAKAFKALDPGDQLKVLTTALEGLGGTAAKVAEQTFGGQWVILSNQWDSLMIVAGQSLMPVITSLTDLLKVNVLPFLKELADDFTALPGPVKDAAVGLGLVLAAVVPLTALVAGAGFAMAGVSTAAGMLGTALEWVGLTGGEAAAGETAAATAAGELAIADTAAAGAAGELAAANQLAATSAGESGLAAAAGKAAAGIAGAGSSAVLADVAFTGFSVTLGFAALAFVSLATGAILAWQELQKGLAPLQALNDEFESWLILQASEVKTGADAQTAQDNLNKAVDAGAISAKDATVVQSYLNDAMAKQGIILIDTSKNWDTLTAAQKSNIALGMSSQMVDLGIHVDGLTDKLTLAQAKAEASAVSMQHLRDNVDTANQKLIDAQTVYDRAAAAGDDLTKATAAVVKAKADDVTATTALTSALTAHLPVVTNVHLATKAFVDTSLAAVDPIKAVADAASAQQTKIDSLTVSLGHAQDNLDKAVEAQVKAKAQYDADGVSLGNLEIANNNVAKAAGILTTVQTNLNTAVAAAQHSFDIASGAVNALGASQMAARGLMDIFNIQLQNMGVFATNSAPQMSPLNQAVIDLKEKTEATHPGIAALMTDIGNVLAAVDNGTKTWTQFEGDLEDVDKQIQQQYKNDLPAQIAAYDALAQKLIDGHAPHALVLSDLQLEEAAIQKYAKEDLPAAIAAQGAYIQKLIDTKQPISDIADNMRVQDAMALKLDQDNILAAEHNHTSASDYIIDMANRKQAIQDEANSVTNILGNSYVALMKTWNDAFTSLGTHLTDGITGAKTWHDAWQGFLQDLEKEILNNLIGVALKALMSQLDQVIGKVLGSGGLSDAFKNAGGGLADLGKKATDAAPQVADMGTKAGGAGAAASAATSSFTSMATAISSIVGALAGIAGDVILITISHDTGKMENTTRGILAEALNLRADAWSQFNGMYDRLGEVWNAIKAMGGGGGDATGQNTNDLLSSMGQTLLEIRDDVSTLAAGGLTTTGGTTSGATDLSGASLAALNSILAAANGIWTDDNLLVLGMQNLAIDIQALGGAVGAGATAAASTGADFEVLFTNTSQAAKDAAAAALQTAKDQVTAATSAADKITALQAEEKANTQLGLIAAKEGNTALAQTYTAANAALAAQVVLLQNPAATTATNTRETATNTNTTATATTGTRQASEDGNRQRIQNAVDAAGHSALLNSAIVTGAIDGVTATGHAAVTVSDSIKLATASLIDLELIRQGIINLNLSLQVVYGDIESLHTDTLIGFNALLAASFTAVSWLQNINTNLLYLRIPAAPPPSKASGGYIPQDAIYQLHAGEVVLTASEVQQGMGTGGGSSLATVSPSSSAGSAATSGPITIQINGSNQSPKQIAASVMDELRRVSPKFSPRSR